MKSEKTSEQASEEVNKGSAANGARPRRSALYMPGANARALEKARGLAADCLILDLEDAVAPEAKADARGQICQALSTGGYGHRELVVRVNGLDGAWGGDDLAALRALPKDALPDAILAPKISTPEDIDAVVAAMPQACALWIMVETPEAILNIARLAARAADTPLACFVLGTNDLAKDMQARLVAGRAPLLPALTLALLAARQHGLSALDGVFNDIADAQGFADECRQGADMGFDGKTLIHPSQLAEANTIFGPSAAEIAEARNVVAAFAAPENAGKGVIKVNGKMTELLHRDSAARLLRIADAIGEANDKASDEASAAPETEA